MYIVEVVITNKRSVRDPEGETIYRELIAKRGYTHIKNVRSGKYLEFVVECSTAEEALNYVKDICHKLRIYNPIVHDITVRLSA